MLGEASLERYRSMTPAERWTIVEELMTFAWRSFLDLPEEERRRRLQVLREEHEAGNRILRERLPMTPGCTRAAASDQCRSPKASASCPAAFQGGSRSKTP